MSLKVRAQLKAIDSLVIKINQISESIIEKYKAKNINTISVDDFVTKFNDVNNDLAGHSLNKRNKVAVESLFDLMCLIHDVLAKIEKQKTLDDIFSLQFAMLQSVLLCLENKDESVLKGSYISKLSKSFDDSFYITNNIINCKNNIAKNEILFKEKEDKISNNKISKNTIKSLILENNAIAAEIENEKQKLEGLEKTYNVIRKQITLDPHLVEDVLKIANEHNMEYQEKSSMIKEDLSKIDELYEDTVGNTDSNLFLSENSISKILEKLDELTPGSLYYELANLIKSDDEIDEELLVAHEVAIGKSDLSLTEFVDKELSGEITLQKLCACYANIRATIDSYCRYEKGVQLNKNQCLLAYNFDKKPLDKFDLIKGMEDNTSKFKYCFDERYVDEIKKIYQDSNTYIHMIKENMYSYKTEVLKARQCASFLNNEVGIDISKLNYEKGLSKLINQEIIWRNQYKKLFEEKKVPESIYKTQLGYSDKRLNAYKACLKEI